MAFLLAACANAPGSALKLGGTTWHLVSAEKGVLAKHARGSGVTLEFGADRVSGYGGCNTYSGAYTFNAGKLKVAPVSATKRGCMDSANETERAWFAALSAPLTVTQRADGLELRTADGVLLRFATGPATKKRP